ncbi:MAG: patatin family protein [Eggerthellales bacterium]|nr:patatin family protein [Eggerthellales bacterium]
MENIDQTAATEADYKYQTPAWIGADITPCNVVLEGGAMRCQFTAGVTDFWMEKKFFPQLVIGTSAGALTGSCYASGLLGRTCFLNLKYCDDPRYLSMKSFVRTGNACGREFVFDEVPHQLDPLDPAAYNDSPVKCVAVSSNLETGEADYHTIIDYEKEIDYLISTSSLPLLSQVVEVDGKKLLDGGNCDSIPVDYSLSTGAKKHIVVLTQAADYVKQPNKLMALMHTVYANYPYFCERAEHRHYEYNRIRRRLMRMHEAGEIFLIMPQKPVEISHMERDQEKLLDLYEQGYAEAMKTWDDLQEYLSRP